ncbi:MAG: NifU family protein [Deltaproteobacteria bacterium]|nr:NifU family protein [Deltaproteobacteria bacterium]
MQEGYHYLFYADGGLAAYPGTLKTSDHPPLDVTQVTGSDPALIARVAALLDRDVRPALVRDGGDLELLSVDDGVVQLRMVGACHGCGAQTMTVQQGIRTYLLHAFPELKAVQDLT